MAGSTSPRSMRRRKSAMRAVLASRLEVAATRLETSTSSVSKVTGDVAASRSGVGGHSLEQSQHGVQPVAQLPAVDDHVDGALLEQELGALEAFGQLLAHRLLDYARAGEADQRLRLGEHHVADHGEARRNAAHG